jgi:hypothetical protein
VGNHAALIRQLYSGKSVTRRGRRSIEFDLGGGRFAWVATVEPLHVRDSGVEINTTWQPDTGAWQWRMIDADYQVHARDVLNAGDTVEWAKGGQTVTLQPLALNWVNNLTDSRQQITQPGAVTATADDATLTWTNGYGAGRHFRYTAHPTRLVKEFILDSADVLPAPEAWLGGNEYLEIEFILKSSAGVILYAEGAAWDKKTKTTTARAITFRNGSGETLWEFAAPAATDSEGDTAGGLLQLRRQGGTHYVTVRFPKAWLDAAAYPVALDPTLLDVQPDASAGVDTYVYRGLPTTNYGTATQMELAAAGDYYRQGLVKFDLSDLEDASITSATLTLYVSTTYEWDPQPIHLHRILAANAGWTETGAKWDYSVGTTRWAGDSGSDGGEDAGCTVPGTDYAAAVMGSRTIPANAAVGSAQAASLDLDEFASLIAANHGLVIEPTSYAPFKVATSDHATTGYRPRLVVEGTAGGGGTDELTATGLATGTPALSAPTLGQAHALSATGWATGALALGTPAIGQAHMLAAVGPATGAPLLGVPAVGQAHALSVAGLSAGAPVLGPPLLTTEGTNALTAAGLTAGVPALGLATIGQVHALVPATLAAGYPALGAPALTAVVALEGSSVISPSPTLGTPTVGQTHLLAAAAVVAGLPAWEGPALGQVHTLSALGLLLVFPAVGAPVVHSVGPTQVGRLTAGDAALYDVVLASVALYDATVRDAACYTATVRDE